MIDYKIKKVNEMTIDELIGQVIMIGLPYDYLDEEYKEFIKQYHIGNYILFARNYTDSKQMKKFMKELYSYTENITNSFPLISIDQEGGMVVRLFKDVTFPASPLTTTFSKVKDAPFITGEIVAKDMLKHGISVNLAPCLEINKNLTNPLVNVRGYGDTKEIVLKNAGKFIKGLQNIGVLSCLKHFPGDGSSTKDSHLELPIIDDPKEQLLNYNMYPFANLTFSDCLMSSHCIYQSFDLFPSTLSKVLLQDILRKDMNFNGLIISDGMEMNAIKDYYGIGDGSVMALNAGCDILLLCHEYDQQKEAFDKVKEAVQKGIISRNTLEEKVERINKAKLKVKNSLIKYFNDLEYEINEEEHEIMETIVDNSYTLLKGKAPVITSNTLVIASNALVGSIVEDEFDDRNLVKAIKHNFPNNKILEYQPNNIFKDEVINNLNNYEAVIFYSYDAYKDSYQIDLINSLLKTNKEIYIVSIKGLSDLPYFKDLENYFVNKGYIPSITYFNSFYKYKTDVFFNTSLINPFWILN